MKCFCAFFFFFFCVSVQKVSELARSCRGPKLDCSVAKQEETKSTADSRWDDSKDIVRLLEAGAHCYLGDTGGLENRPELRGDWRLKEWEGEAEVGDTLRGLLRSPLWSFHSSSSFSMDRRLFTLDSFCRDSCSTACSVDSCL